MNKLNNPNDVYFGMSWQEFKELIVSKGFIAALEYDFEHHMGVKTYKDEFIIYYDPLKGLIISASSVFNKKSIGSGCLYGEIQVNSEKDIQTIWKYLGSGRRCNNLVFETRHGLNDRLFFKLDKLESAGKFLPKWTNANRFLWFVSYTEEQTKDFDYKKITHDKIMRCPKELQEIVSIAL